MYPYGTTGVIFYIIAFVLHYCTVNPHREHITGGLADRTPTKNNKNMYHLGIPAASIGAA